MDVKYKMHKKQTTTFDYEKEMEQALSTIFRNLRGIEEMRFRITSNKGDSGPEFFNVCTSASKPTSIELHQDLSELSENQENIQKEQVANDSVHVKCKRRLPDVPARARGLTQ